MQVLDSQMRAAKLLNSCWWCSRP